MPDSPNRRVILAEDEPATRALLVRQLTAAGYDVNACSNGEEALKAIRREGAGIILADWMMPEMDGLELCRVVQELREMGVLRVVYFILLTAHCEKSDVVTGLKTGADDYLTKPYHNEELLARLRAGERILELQDELVHRQLELQKVNAEMVILNAQLERLANTDALTGLANRRHVFERLYDAWALSERQKHPLACVMLDVDRFKRVNDTYGHAAGDVVLKQIAATIKRLARRYDICGRFGGEEFIIICPATTLEGAGTLAERVRSEVAQHSLTADGASISVSISAGVAARHAGHTDPEALIGQADRALYRAKDNGRNRVWITDHDGREYPLLVGIVAG